MRLGVVGHAAEKFTSSTRYQAYREIEQAIRHVGAHVIVSGRSPMGGVDVWAEEIAEMMGLPTDIKIPRQHSWDGEYGFKARNLDIARSSDRVMVVVVRELPKGYRGMRFDGCYHCGDRNPPHVKSGGCWTAWKCKGGREWVIL